MRPKLNPADLPTRAKIFPYRAAFSPRLWSLGALFRSCRSQLRLMYLEKPHIARKRTVLPIALKKKNPPQYESD